jgi:hypothetical protein
MEARRLQRRGLMLKTRHPIYVVFAVTILGAAACASDTDTDQSVDQADIDGSHFELANKSQLDAVQLDPLGADTQILFGCSNAQIRSAQAACRNTFCGTRGSNGIHFCDQRPPIVVAQCDCRTGADPTIQCSLTSCPQ